MKFLTLILISGLFFSFSAFADRGYDRGYSDGKQTCGNELWTCSANCNFPLEFKNQYVIKEGFSRAQALSAIIEYARNCRRINNCVDVIRAGLAECKSI